MSDLKQTETLTKRAETVIIDGETRTINTFCLAKTIRTFQYVSELAAAAGLGEAAQSAMQEDITTGEMQLNLVSIIGKLVGALPKLLAEGVPTVYKLLGLIVTGNKELRRLEEKDGVDVEAELLAKGRDIAYCDEGTEAAVALVMAAVKVMGTDTIVKNLAPLLGLLRR